MMSASGGGSWKSRCSKGGCVNFILQISSKCGQGEKGVKKKLRMSLTEAPLDYSNRNRLSSRSKWKTCWKKKFCASGVAQMEAGNVVSLPPRLPFSESETARAGVKTTYGLQICVTLDKFFTFIVYYKRQARRFDELSLPS